MKKKNKNRRIICLLLSVFMVLMLISNSSLNCIGGVKAAGYNASAACDYAMKYARSRNPAYTSYSSNCANFVQQCLAAGGITVPRQTGPGPWDYNTCTRGIYKYLKDQGYTIKECTTSNCIPGNPVFCVRGNNPDTCEIPHVVICSAVTTDGKSLLCGNTTDMYNRINYSYGSGYHYFTAVINTKITNNMKRSDYTTYGGSNGGSNSGSSSVLKKGSRGSLVSDLQTKLNLVSGAGLSVDGSFGKLTYNAVVAFQRAFGLSVDGQVGNQTWTKLNEEWNARQVVYPTSVSISANSMQLTVGYPKQLSASVNPGNSTNKSISWKSSNGNIATVDGNGRVTGVGKGTATITASSSNGKTASCNVTVYDPVYVTFVNYDDSELQKVKLEYGGTATAPKNPERTGYKFEGWDGVYQNVKNDAIVKATYSKLKYKVEFKETDGTSIVAAQKIPYQEAAVAPSESDLSIPKGYIFEGWSDSFDCIESDMTINPVYKWKDGQLPLVVDADENACTANYDEGIYTVKFNLKNHSSKVRNARVMIYMMTDGGKMVAQGETRTVKVPAGKVKETEGNDGTKGLLTTKAVETVDEKTENNTDDMHTPNDATIEETDETNNRNLVTSKGIDEEDEVEEIIEDGVVEIDDLYVVCKSPADKARILVLDDYESAVPLAEIEDIPVAAAGYGDWQDEEKESDAPVENRVVYRSKTINYTTSTTASSIDGWVKYNQTSERVGAGDKNYYGNGRSASAPGVNGAFRQWPETISYAYNPDIYPFPNRNISISTYGDETYKNMVRWIQTCLCRFGYGTAIDGVFGSGTAAVVKSFQSNNGLSADGIVGANTRNKMRQILDSQPIYNYYYESAKTNYTYYFYQEAPEWSEWTTDAIEGDTTLNAGKTKTLVESKTQYRYKENVVETTGTMMTPDCSLPAEAMNLAGKEAVVIVFKNKVNQIAEDNVEYIGNTVIGTDGKLNISFVPREEISYEGTGDYTIVLGVKGTTNYVKVGTIEAPKPTYKVSFIDINGSEISSQDVIEGHDAVSPEAPDVEGFRFVGWDTGVTNIHDNITVTAQYEKKNCKVTFVDWENKNIDTIDVAYGEPLVYPNTPEAPEGKEFKSWSIPENTEITEDVVCEAQYDIPKFTVSFVDYNGKKVEQVEVPYGESVLTPLVLSKEEVEEGDIYVPVEEDVKDEDNNVVGKVYFDSWSDEFDLSCITSNIVVGAIYKFDETVATPKASVTTGEYTSAQTVSLTTETEDAIIFYTLDGSDPTDIDNKGNIYEYTKPITVTDKTVLRFYAEKMGYNSSEVVEEWYAINTPGNVPTHVVDIKAICDFEYLDTPSGYKGFFEDGNVLALKNVLSDDYDNIELKGVYYNIEDLDEWQDNETITESLVLYAWYGPKEYNVTYKDIDGNKIAESKAQYGTEVDTEIIPEKEGFHFAGLTSDDDYSCVTKDISVTVNYIENSKFANIKFPRSSYSIMEGSSYKLNPKVTYEADGSTASGEIITYSSSDNETATIDELGNVNALKKGEVTITAKVESSGTTAQCTIKISGNPDTSIVLYSNSKFKIDNGYLRNIDIDKNTVAEIRKHINADADRLWFLDYDNEKLEESTKVGTGVYVRLVDDEDRIVDTLQVVLLADYNGDGKISSMDVSGVSRALLGKEIAEQVQLVAVDVNGDGNVNNRDAAMIARYLVGKEKLGGE